MLTADQRPQHWESNPTMQEASLSIGCKAFVVRCTSIPHIQEDTSIACVVQGIVPHHVRLLSTATAGTSPKLTQERHRHWIPMLGASIKQPITPDVNEAGGYATMAYVLLRC